MKIIEERSPDGFFRPIVVNDWGAIGYFERAVKSNAGTWGLAEQDQKLRIRPGETVTVKWNDGSISTETVKAIQRYASVPDCGRSYDVPQELLVIETVFRGHTIWFQLNEGFWIRRG